MRGGVWEHLVCHWGCTCLVGGSIIVVVMRVFARPGSWRADSGKVGNERR